MVQSWRNLQKVGADDALLAIRLGLFPSALLVDGESFALLRDVGLSV